MKTYLLRGPKPVQQSVRSKASPSVRGPKSAEPSPAATTRTLLGTAALAPKGPTLFVGLDVHTESIAVSLAPSDSTEVRRYGMIGGTHNEVLRLAKKLQATHPGVRLRCLFPQVPP